MGEELETDIRASPKTVGELRTAWPANLVVTTLQ